MRCTALTTGLGKPGSGLQHTATTFPIKGRACIFYNVLSQCDLKLCILLHSDSSSKLVWHSANQSHSIFSSCSSQVHMQLLFVEMYQRHRQSRQRTQIFHHGYGEPSLPSCNPNCKEEEYFRRLDELMECQRDGLVAAPVDDSH